MRNTPEPQTISPTITESQFKGDDSLNKAISFAGEATAQYAINEKKQFDLARLTEARNMLDVHETRLAADEKNGWQNKLGQNAVLFKDEDGKDFMGHYSDQYQNGIRDVETQLQLTPDQKKIFSEYAQQKAVGLNSQLMTHQLRQGKEYKVSVFENAVAIAGKKAQGQFTDFAEMDKTIEQGTADIGALGQELGWSNVEKSRKAADFVNGIHTNNVNGILDTGDFMTAEAYVKQYGSKMSELQKLSTETKIKKMKDDFVAAQFIQLDTQAMTTGSNPAFNSNDLGTIKATARIDPSEFGNLKYNDPRLDSLAVVTAKDLKMDWAIPVVTAIRVAGEKSNNNQVSSANAQGVYQFTPIAIEQVRRITGKKIDPNNPEEASWGALKFIQWISEKYNTQDPAIIASYYNGGGQFVDQLKKGGVAAITNKENRNYVARISGFDFNSYANSPVAPNGLNLNLVNVTPENQAKILANKEKIRSQQKKQAEEQQQMTYEKASDLLESGQYSYEQLSKSPEILKALNAKQINALRLQDKAKKTGNSSGMLNEVYQNPAALKGMPQSQFNSMITNTSDSEQKELSKMYAKANGRDVESLSKAEAEAAKKNGSKSLVTHKLIYNVVRDNAGTLGFSGTSSSTKKIKNSNTDSQFYIEMKDDIYARIAEQDQRYFNANGKHLTEFQIRNISKAYFDSSTRMQGKERVRVYDPVKFSRKDLTDGQKANILKLAQRDGHKYSNADTLPDNLFTRYYFQFYRGKVAR